MSETIERFQIRVDDAIRQDLRRRLAVDLGAHAHERLRRATPLDGKPRCPLRRGRIHSVFSGLFLDDGEDSKLSCRE